MLFFGDITVFQLFALAAARPLVGSAIGTEDHAMGTIRNTQHLSVDLFKFLVACA